MKTLKTMVIAAVLLLSVTAAQARYTHSSFSHHTTVHHYKKPKMTCSASDRKTIRCYKPKTQKKHLF